MNTAWSDPVLSCAEAKALEARLFGGDEDREWAAMQRAGAAVAGAVLDDFREIGGFPAAGRILVLAGKGHNGGDALIATRILLERFPGARAQVWFSAGERAFRPLAWRAWRDLQHAAAGRVARISFRKNGAEDRGSWDLCLDGIFGYQFHPPIDETTAEVLRRINADPGIRLRAAVDLPSGLAEMDRIEHPVFRADFTYATGVVKLPVLDAAQASTVGRLRYLDLGFFERATVESKIRVLTSRVLAPLRALRPPGSDKRAFGHLFVVGGSRHLPGSVLMAVRAALRSGAGLVTAFVPESFAAAFAAGAPEAMWVGWPETPGGGLALEGGHLLRERLGRATAMVVGPGLGQEAETLALVTDMVANSPVPLVLDADALRPDVVRAGTTPRVLTPHVGEFMRLLAGGDFGEFQQSTGAVTVLKGRLTSITQRDRGCYDSPFGGPVLARGGSGDLLAGLIGGLLAQVPDDPLQAACRGVVWHGLAADLLARDRGQGAIEVTQLLDYLPAALRVAADER